MHLFDSITLLPKSLFDEIKALYLKRVFQLYLSILSARFMRYTFVVLETELPKNKYSLIKPSETVIKNKQKLLIYYSLKILVLYF